MFNSQKLQTFLGVFFLSLLFPAFLCIVEALVRLLYSNSRFLLDVCSLQDMPETIISQLDKVLDF